MIFSLALVAMAVASAAEAQPIRPYTPAAFTAAQHAGAPILVDIHADWCPTCRKQAPTIDALSRDPAFGKVVILKIDFDSQAADWKALGAQKQSTLIVFKGKQETGRGVGTTDPQAIRTLVASALR
jgi:thiol-disulfide isomerase/thioredoxin